MHCYAFYKYLNTCFMADLDCLRRGLGLIKGKKCIVCKGDLILYPPYISLSMSEIAIGLALLRQDLSLETKA